MTLSEKIKSIYPSLTSTDFDSAFGTISLQDNSDGNGPFIAKWEHPTFSKPTAEKLA